MSISSRKICRITPLWVVLAVLWGKMEAEETTDELPPVLVTADRLEKEAVPIPGNDTVISREAISRSGAGTVADLLQSEAGLPFGSFYGNPALGTPVIRGFAENASSRTLILVDGLPVSRPDLGAAPWYQFPLVGLEEVKVMRGSRTVRYGSGALGGVIALKTARHGNEFGGFIEGRYGSDDTYLFQGNIHFPVGEWEVSATFDDTSSDGYRQNSGYDSTSWSAVLSSPLDSEFEGRWMVAGNDLYYENPGALSESEFREDPRQSRYVRFNQADQFFNEIESVRASQHLTWDLGREKSFSFLSSWFERERQLNFGPGSHSDNDLEAISVEAVLSSAAGPTRWEMGARIQSDDLELVRYRELERLNPLSNASLTREIWGVFALAHHELDNDWSVSGGIGWESYELDARGNDDLSPLDPDLNFSEDSEESDVSAEFALEYSGGENWDAWLRYDRIYRFPVMDEVAAYQGFVLSEPFNANLDPESGHAVEVGINIGEGGLQIGLTAFAQWLEGEIGYDFVENSNVNFADTRRLGIEMNASYQAECWNANLNYTGISAEFQSGEFSGNRVPLVPKHVVSGSAIWIPRDDLAISLEGTYVSSSPEGNDFQNTNESLPSYAVFNAQCRWEMRENLSVFLRVNNLFDREYATLKFVSQWYPAPGRQILGGMKWEF